MHSRSLATLTYEILLTRIFSVTMWYHFAFVAISIAMFGMTVGALIVYLVPKWFPDEGVPHRLAICSLAFGATALLALFAHLRIIPFIAQRSLLGVSSLALTFAVISVPFVFSGICVSVVLTRYPSRVGSLYAADLVGAALGCVTLIWALEVTDGPTVAVIVAAIACLGALAFSHGLGMSLVRRVSVAAFILLVAVTTVNTVLVQRQAGLMPLTWVKGRTEPRPLWESWNSYSRLAISGSPEARQLQLNIDASAATMITRFDGDVRDLEFLKDRIHNLAHYLRREADVLVVGVGGGIDLLSAVAFDQRHVVGVELNQDILRVLTDVYADYSGTLATDPRITLINDEARAYVISHDSRFDIIQISSSILGRQQRPVRSSWLKTRCIPSRPQKISFGASSREAFSAIPVSTTMRRRGRCSGSRHSRPPRSPDSVSPTREITSSWLHLGATLRSVASEPS